MADRGTAERGVPVREGDRRAGVAHRVVGPKTVLIATVMSAAGASACVPVPRLADDGGTLVDALLTEPIDAGHDGSMSDGGAMPDARSVDAGCQLLPFAPSNFDMCQLNGLNEAISLTELFDPDDLRTSYRIDTENGLLSRDD